MNDLGSVWCDDIATKQHALFVANQLHKAITKITGVAPGNDIEWCDCSIDAEVALDTIIFGEANAGNARKGESEAS